MPKDEFPWPRSHHFLVQSTQRMRVLKRELKAEEKFYNKLKARLDQAYDPDFDADAQFE